MKIIIFTTFKVPGIILLAICITLLFLSAVLYFAPPLFASIGWNGYVSIGWNG